MLSNPPNLIEKSYLITSSMHKSFADTAVWQGPGAAFSAPAA